MFKYVTGLLIFLCYQSCFAERPIENVKFEIAGTKVSMEYNDQGELIIADALFLEKSMPSLLEAAKKVFCKSKIKPESVTISVGLFSGTWSIDKLCKDQK